METWNPNEEMPQMGWQDEHEQYHWVEAAANEETAEDFRALENEEAYYAFGFNAAFAGDDVDDDDEEENNDDDNEEEKGDWGTVDPLEHPGAPSPMDPSAPGSAV
ncbi:MAG: hypothetical protein CFE23_09645 [Flavobacterium sp. BFFFF1]|uniref:hypothetical protein n=1 Tax=unclassified Flavobacterium TaxID=196869 RepID=UPI000BCF5292|nr:MULTISPECIES: hypothetical protein [unclassified Flavobacterium]OYU80321.1 MAG: hypothetical protein CFE23_09645 [Flavobacterium sp. BFFFF1]